MKKLAILTLIFCIVMMFATACFQPSGGGEGGSGEQGGEGGSGEGEGGGSGEGEGGGDQPGEGGGDQPGEGGGDQPGEGGGDQPGEGGGDQPGEGGGDQPGEGGGDPIEVVKPAAPSADLFAGVPSGDLGFDYGADNLNEETYEEAISPNGWVAQNVKVFVGGEDHEMFGESYALVLNGAPATAGHVTSALIGNGISSFSFNYGFVYAADTQFSITITIYQLVDGEVQAVASTVVEIKDIEAETKYSYTWDLETALTGNYVIQIANNCLSGEKDRVAIWDLSWVSVAPEIYDFDCMPRTEKFYINSDNPTENTASIVDKDNNGNRVLKIDKTNATLAKNFRIWQYVNTAAEDANKAVFTAKFFIETIGGKAPSFEFFLRQGEGYDPETGLIGTDMKQSPNFLECTAKNAAEGTVNCNENAAGTTFPMPIGEWVDIKIEYTVTKVSYEGDKVTGIKFEYFLNGESKLVGTTVYGADIKSGTVALPFADEITHMCFILYTDNVGVYYFDDMKLDLVKDETVAAPEKDAPCEHRDADDDKKCDKCKADFEDQVDGPYILETFDEMKAADFVVDNFFAVPGADNIISLVAKGEGDNAIYLDKATVNGTRFLRKPTYVEEGADQVVVSFDFKVENITKADGTPKSLANEIYITDASGNNSIYFYLVTSGSNYAVTPYGADKVTTDIAAAEWNNFKFIYNGEKCDMYINGGYICTTNTLNKGKALPTVAEVSDFRIWFGGSTVCDAYFDNISVVKTVDRSVEKFNGESLPAGYTGASNNADNKVSVVDKGNGDKALLLDKVNSGSGTTTSLTVKGDDVVRVVENNANISIIAFDILYTDVTAKGNFEFWVYNAAGGEIALPYFSVTGTDAGSAIKVKDLRNGTLAQVETGIVVGTWATVMLKIDSADGSWDLYVNDNLVFSGLLSSNASAAALAGQFKLSMDNSSGAKMYIDNVKFWNVYEEPAPEVSDFAKKFDGNYEVAGPDGVAFTFAFTPDEDNGNNGTLVLVDSYHAEDASLSGTYTYAVGEDNAVVVKDASGADMTEKFNFSMNLGGGIAFQWAGVPMAQDLVAAAAAE